MQTGIPPTDEHLAHGPGPAAAKRSLPAPRAPYVPPALERLGPWEAFTLQQSIPIWP